MDEIKKRRKQNPSTLSYELYILMNTIKSKKQLKKIKLKKIIERISAKIYKKLKNHKSFEKLFEKKIYY